MVRKNSFLHLISSSFSIPTGVYPSMTPRIPLPFSLPFCVSAIIAFVGFAVAQKI